MLQVMILDTNNLQLIGLILIICKQFYLTCRQDPNTAGQSGTRSNDNKGYTTFPKSLKLDPYH